MGKTRRFKKYKSTLKNTHETTRLHKRQRYSHNPTEFTLSPETKKMLEPFVKNLSDIKLSDIQISALAKGLKHIPTPDKPSRTELVQDVDLLQRRMRIRYIMRNKKNSKILHKFRLPSTWTPLHSGSIALETYLEKTKEKICHLRFKPPQSNLTHMEKKALKELSDNKTITIKKFDKGRGVAILDTHIYNQTGLNHLHSHHYELIPDDQTYDTAHRVQELLEEMNELDLIDDDTYMFLNPFSHPIRTSEMYFLPKLHKSPPSDGSAKYEIRPILSGINNATYSISKFVDYFLAPIAASQPTYIRDSTDVILKLQNYTLSHNTLIATIDVKAMYTNIDHDMAIKATTEAYDSRKVKYDIRPIPTKYLKELLSIILENNTFKFNGLDYRQRIGLAMGSPASVSIANISLHPLEMVFLNNTTDIICFFRFIDDIILLSNSPHQVLEDQIQYLNSLHPNLKFTAEISDSAVNFLDLTIYKGKNFDQTGKLSTKIFTKPVDTFQYIMPTSTHPPSTFKAFIYGEFLRIIRNTSEKEECFKTSSLFVERLLRRGYTEDFINNIRQSVSHDNRQKILEETGKKQYQDKQNVPLVFTTKYTGYLLPKQIKTSLLEHWHLITNNAELNKTFPQPPIIAFKRSTNIQDILIRSKSPDDGLLDILLELVEET